MLAKLPFQNIIMMTAVWCYQMKLYCFGKAIIIIIMFRVHLGMAVRKALSGAKKYVD